MASAAIGEVVRQVHRLYGEGTVAGLSEGELLDQFSRRRDELAFAALVARHGAMVRGVCRGVLRDPNDADDAFQATFLVLARKAGTIRGREALGGWLHRVARRVAVRASVESARRRGREQPGALVDEPIAPGEDPDRRELCRLVHEEVDRLPENYRKAVVLCDLEGFTHEEAAARLDWPVGTVKGRLFRARDRLKDRLVRRGLTASVASAAGLVREASASVVPDLLLQSTVKIATSIAASRASAGLVPASIALAEEVIRAMFWNKIKIAAVSGMGLLAVTLGVGSMAVGGPRGGGRETEVAAKGDAAANAEDLHKAIQGVWYYHYVQENGITTPLTGFQVRIGAEAFAQEKPRPAAPTPYVLIDGRSPVGIDLTRIEQDSLRSSVLPGIIKLEGDTLTICWAPSGSPRPEEFAAPKGFGRFMHVLGRKPLKAPTRSKEVQEEFRKAIQGDWYVHGHFRDGGGAPVSLEPLQITADGIGYRDKPGQLGKYTLRMDQEPIGFDLVPPGSNPDLGMFPGIIKLENGIMQICWAPPGSPRPEEFSFDSGSGREYHNLHRSPQGYMAPEIIAGTRVAAADQTKAKDSAEAPAAEAKFRNSEVEDFRKAIQGDWYPRSIVKNGTPATIPDQPLRITADEIGERGKPRDQAKYSLQLNRSPIGIEIIMPIGPEEGKTIAGVIKLEGDLLTVCWARPGAPRAEEFVSRKGSEHQLTVLSRKPAEPGTEQVPVPVASPTPAKPKTETVAELEVEIEFRASEVQSRGQAAFQEMESLAITRRKRDALKAGQPQPVDPLAGEKDVKFETVEEADKAVLEAEKGLERAQKEHREAIRLRKVAEAKLAELMEKAPAKVSKPTKDAVRETREKIEGDAAEVEARVELEEIDLQALKAQISAAQQSLYTLQAQNNDGRDQADRNVIKHSLNRVAQSSEEMKAQYLRKSKALGRLRAEAARLRREAASIDPTDAAGKAEGKSKKVGVQVGDVIVVEVLEALPGRPISGARKVREDGTISLGFYGDLPVAGLDRKQIKEAVIKQLQKSIGDDVLGLVVEGEDGKKIKVAPADSDRVYVDDSPIVAPPPAPVQAPSRTPIVQPPSIDGD